MELVDLLVDRRNLMGLESEVPEHVPQRLRVGVISQQGFCHWKIRPSGDIHWIEPFEARLPYQLPPSFRSLITRYVFLPFRIGPITLLGNTGEERYGELCSLKFGDQDLALGLFQHGYLPFAHPIPWNGDPVCFDMKRRDESGEAPIVKVDHEGILCGGRIIVKAEFAPSFVQLISDFLAL